MKQQPYKFKPLLPDPGGVPKTKAERELQKTMGHDYQQFLESDGGQMFDPEMEENLDKFKNY